MKSLIASALMLLLPAIVLAQSATDGKAALKPAAKTAASSKENAKVKAKTTPPVAKKTTIVAKKSDATSSRTQLRSATSQVAAGIIAAEAALTPEELAIAERVHVGRMPCELGAFVTVTADTASPGRFHVEGRGFKYYMSPVTTSTGTVRLQDEKSGAVWLQILNKSMLMNQRIGQRLADECMSPEQVLVAESIKKSPPVSVFDPLPVSK
ncbi:MAG: hypothetical protein K2Q97_15175 [Burkholderiaceae bacterium]|nr:hypothetical protein [Burkholderiaceae bacterium]